eukprot:g21711.t1
MPLCMKPSKSSLQRLTFSNTFHPPSTLFPLSPLLVRRSMAAPPTALAPAPAAPAAPAESSASVKSIMARFWYSCALFCGAALLLPLLKPQMENDEDLSVEDVSGHQLQLGVTFFAIAVMAWTFIAAWFCYCSPLLFTEESIRRAKGSEGRYGDAISECHAALVLMPSLQLTTRALQRLAAAHICLKNHWEALRCLQNCLELEPGNALLQKLMQRLERQRAASSPQLEVPCDLVWSDICIQGAGFARDKGARKRKGKQKSRLLPGEERQIEREAGIWHTMVAHNSKLYIFGGLQSAGEAQEKDLNLESSSTGSEELQILDLDTLELFQSSGSSRVPQACYCHSATVLDNSMLIFGGSVDGLMVFDFAAAKWRSQPCQGPHPRRQGHSATAMEQGLCVYGGIELMEQCNGRVCNDAHLLDTKSWTWKKLDCAGTIPAARFGHTATKLSPPGPPGLLIIGGRDQMTSSRDFVHDHSGLHILDTSKRSWSEQGFTGKPPEKVFGHFACTWTARSLLLVTGEASEKRDTQGVELFFLDLEKWIWSQPVVAGLLPCSRLGHAVAAADERVYLFGGLILRGDQPAVDKTIYMLQTEGMRDSKISKELWDLDELERISPEEKSERQILGDEESPGVSGDKEVLTDLPGPETCEFAGDQNEEGEDEPELTFEELLEQEKAFFKLQSKKASFPRQQDLAQIEVARLAASTSLGHRDPGVQLEPLDLHRVSSAALWWLACRRAKRQLQQGAEVNLELCKLSFLVILAGKCET